MQENSHSLKSDLTLQNTKLMVKFCTLQGWLLTEVNQAEKIILVEKLSMLIQFIYKKTDGA